MKAVWIATESAVRRVALARSAGLSNFSFVRLGALSTSVVIRASASAHSASSGSMITGSTIIIILARSV